MIWKKITIETTTEASDIVASVLFDNNIVGAEIEDNKNLTSDELSQMYVDIPKINVDDGKAKVSFYVSVGDKKNLDIDTVNNNLVDYSYMKSNDNIFSSEELEGIITNIKNELNDYKNFMDMGSLVFSEENLDDNIFLNKWKENFKSLKIDNINIIPSWDKNKASNVNEINIYIEPGNAFGTGQHATTKLCVMELEKLVNKNTKVLDIGAGSGILSIISYVLKANSVTAIDIDKNVEFNLLENIKLNGIRDSYKITSDNYNLDGKGSFIYGFGNILTDEWLKNYFKDKKYDIIVANILTPVLVSLIKNGNIINYINDNGYLLLSGIIKGSEIEVIDAIKSIDSNCKLNVKYDNEWTLIEYKL